MKRSPIEVDIRDGNTLCFKLPPEYLIDANRIALLMDKVCELIHFEIAEKYLRDAYDMYIEKFLRGACIYEHSEDLGHVWIAWGHLDLPIDVLTIEPLDGGQYEVAVRWKVENGEWQGYAISTFNQYFSFLIGHNTKGH